jgi:carbamoyltransferase
VPGDMTEMSSTESAEKWREAPCAGGVLRGAGRTTYVLGYCGIEGSREFSAEHGWGTAIYGHDSTAVLLADGEVIAAAEEERFTREKHTARFPLHAMEYCLRQAKIDFDRVDHICYNWAHNFRSRLLTTVSFLREMPARFVPRAMRLSLDLERRIFSKRKVLADFCALTGYRPPARRFHFVNHHLAHAASTFYGSPNANALVVTVDGMGEYDSSLFAVGEGNRLRPIDRLPGPTSIGQLYQMVTQYLGFKPEYDEYKVMGMAPYGDPAVFRAAVSRILTLLPEGRYRTALPGKVTILDREAYVRGLEDAFGPRRRPADPVDGRHQNVAAAVQEASEGALLHILRHWAQRTGLRDLCMAGGVALNSSANGKILSKRMFDSIWIPPVPGDNGGALGAAWYCHHDLLQGGRCGGLRTPFTGPGYSRGDVLEALSAYDGRLRVGEHLGEAIEDQAAVLLAHGAVIGWFQGRMELGPRALGNRSILADPRDATMRDRVNARIKRRELFRPFAPAVLREAAAEYFDLHGATTSPYMLFVFPVREEKRAVIPAVTHIDGSARVQTVDRHENPRFWGLIEKFGRLTGVPVILNTSFNVQGEPIVCSPADALRCLLSTELDALVIGDFLVERVDVATRGKSGARRARKSAATRADTRLC